MLINVNVVASDPDPLPKNFRIRIWIRDTAVHKRILREKNSNKNELTSGRAVQPQVAELA
jgi:hypothetical protein